MGTLARQVARERDRAVMLDELARKLGAAD